MEERGRKKHNFAFESVGHKYSNTHLESSSGEIR